jgi:hypothetical protein
MSEVTEKLQRMLAQAQIFSQEQIPLEAVARAKLAVRESEQALETATGPEREQLIALRAIAASRAERYEAQRSSWTKGVAERANQFELSEQEKLKQPIATKG